MRKTLKGEKPYPPAPAPAPSPSPADNDIYRKLEQALETNTKLLHLIKIVS